MDNRFQRDDVAFFSKGTRCSAWLYLPIGERKCPVIVMAHGLGGVRDMRLYEYAERFALAGYACFLFDYRNFGASDGKKRQLVSVKKQLEDWNNAIDCIKKDNRVDGNKILLFGSSFSGGHVVTLSSHRNDIKAAVAQCPYTNSRATIRAVSLAFILKKVPYVIADILSCLTGYHPVMLKLSAPKGVNALMESDDETTKKFIGNATYVNQVPARTILEFLKYSPCKYTLNISIPVFFAVCQNDILAPAKETINCVRRAKTAIVKEYDCGHFDIYLDAYVENAINDYIDFYNQVCE